MVLSERADSPALPHFPKKPTRFNYYLNRFQPSATMRRWVQAALLQQGRGSVRARRPVGAPVGPIQESSMSSRPFLGLMALASTLAASTLVPAQSRSSREAIIVFKDGFYLRGE